LLKITYIFLLYIKLLF